MNKEELLRHIKQDIYCRVMISTIPNAGVGVVAVRDIPKGICPFNGIPSDEFILVSKEELADVPEEIKKMVHDFCFEEEGKFYVPDFGLNSMNVSYFMNQSSEPNIDAGTFKTIREIKKGEELTINYDEL